MIFYYKFKKIDPLSSLLLIGCRPIQQEFSMNENKIGSEYKV